jgi:hypothetical protein
MEGREQKVKNGKSRSHNGTPVGVDNRSVHHRHRQVEPEHNDIEPLLTPQTDNHLILIHDQTSSESLGL